MFRVRSAFTVWIAPYLIFGGYIIAIGGEINLDQARNWELYSSNRWFWVLFISYIVLGILAGAIETNLWKRCDKLNFEILRIYNVQSENAKPAVKFKTVITIFSYIIVFVSLILSFVAVLNLSQVMFASATAGVRSRLAHRGQPWGRWHGSP